MELVIGIIVGGILSWFISHIYYKKSTTDQEKLFNKLSSKVRETILSSDKEKLSIKELNELLEQKTIDHDTNDPLPFKACPKCGNETLDHSSYSDERDSAFFVTCPKCKWTDMA